MKAAVWVVIALVAGFLLGGLGPRRDLAATQAKVDDLTRRAEAAEKKASRRGSDRFLMLPEIPSVSAATAAPKASPTEGGKDGAESPDPTGTPVDAMKAFDLAVEAQRMRAHQSRTALSEAAKLDPKQEQKVDDVVAKMNAELSQHAKEIADVMRSVNAGEEPDPLEMLTITRDVSSILVDSQAAFQTAVGTVPEGLDPSATQVWNYVDLSIFHDVMQNLPPGIAPPGTTH